MGKLIDVDVAIRAAVEYIEDWNRAKSIYHRRELTKKFIALPSVDAVSVVRCKGCKHYEWTANRVPEEQTWWCYKHNTEMGNNDYCSYGERDGDGNVLS